MQEGLNKFKLKFSRSLRADLFVIICLAGIIPCVILSWVLLYGYERHAISSRTKLVQNQCLVIADHLFSAGFPEVTDNEIANSELAQLSNLYDGRVLIINSDLKIVKDTYSLGEGKYMISNEVAKGLSGESTAKYDKEDHYIETVTPIMGKNPDAVGVMLTSVSTAETDSIIKSLRRLSTLIITALAAVVIGIAFLFAARITGQFRRLSASVENIREGFGLDDEISIFPYRETEQINESFKQVLSRMKTLDDSRSEFVANVSHELKTPITSVKVLAESLLAQNEVPNEIYREFMEDIAVEVDREDRIINDLLSLVKMDRAGANLQIEKCDIEQMIEKVVRRLTPIADKEHVELIYEVIRHVEAEVDETKLSLALTNIIENGIKYNHEGGSVRVTLDSEPMMFTVTVADTGMGIPEEDLPNVFERFYRVDKSHSRSIGGTGLGLAIAKGSVLMHKGVIKAESTVGEGSVFEIKIPISYIVSPTENEVLRGSGDNTHV